MILVRIHLPTALPVQSMKRTSIIGKQQSWALMSPHMMVAFSSWTFTSQLTTHSSHQRSTSPRGSIIRTLTRMGPSASISWRNNGPQLWQSPKCSFPSAPCCVMPTLMILWYLKLPNYTSQTSPNMSLPQENGLENMPCECENENSFNNFNSRKTMSMDSVCRYIGTPILNKFSFIFHIIIHKLF